MACTKRFQYPFQLVLLEEEIQKRIASDFLGYPNGLQSCNHWGFKLSATTTEQEIEDLYNYPLDPRDVWVVAPPKCGTTWTQEMVWLIANDLNYEEAKTPLIPVRWNFVDIAALLDKPFVNNMFAQLTNVGLSNHVNLTGDPNRPSPKFVKSHLPMSMNNPRLLDTCKVVYVASNPKDACVSFYNHNRLIRLHEFTGDTEMASAERVQYPFQLVPLEEEIQKKIASDFLGYPNGLQSCNHWGFKLSATATEQEIEDLYNYPLDPRDVWIVTPPKCGTTWTQEMIWLIANDLDYEGAKTPLMPVRWNFVDIAALLDKPFVNNMFAQLTNVGPGNPVNLTGDPNRPSPKFVKSHLPMSMNNPRLLDTCKVVYVARNPKDACVSFYNHNRVFRLHEFTGDIELFMNYFMDGDIAQSPLIEHMIEAWNLRHHPNMCFIFYEDMKSDLKSQIRKVATFLGKYLSDKQIEKLANHLHIDNFKKNEFVNAEFGKKTGLMHKDRGDFIRKGKTGDWKNHFTPEMNAKFDRWMATKLKGTDLKFVMELEHQD